MLTKGIIKKISNKIIFAWQNCIWRKMATKKRGQVGRALIFYLSLETKTISPLIINFRYTFLRPRRLFVNRVTFYCYFVPPNRRFRSFSLPFFSLLLLCEKKEKRTNISLPIFSISTEITAINFLIQCFWQHTHAHVVKQFWAWQPDDEQWAGRSKRDH